MKTFYCCCYKCVVASTDWLVVKVSILYIEITGNLLLIDNTEKRKRECIIRPRIKKKEGPEGRMKWEKNQESWAGYACIGFFLFLLHSFFSSVSLLFFSFVFYSVIFSCHYKIFSCDMNVSFLFVCMLNLLFLFRFI